MQMLAEPLYGHKMKIQKRSRFKDEQKAVRFFDEWVSELEKLNGRSYERIQVHTSLGKTHLWGLNTTRKDLETLVIFPGARTTSLFWDLDRGLDNLDQPLRVFMVETNGLPNLSDGATPDIRSLDYGLWANEVLEQLEIDRAFVAGASFGGLICMKLGITDPEKIKAAFLLNPGCLQPFSMGLKNLYYNLLPIASPTVDHVSTFLNEAVFCKPYHHISSSAERMMLDYEVFVLKEYKDNTQKPYYMGKQLADVEAETYLLEGDKDLLFPFQLSVDNASKHIRHLMGIRVFENVGHGIETYAKALHFIGETIVSRECVMR